MRALWLASWYPHQLDPYNGDFIQRHAISAATRFPVTLLHVEKLSGRDADIVLGKDNTIITSTEKEHLTEKIAYFRASGHGFRWWRFLRSQLKTFLLYRQMVKDYTKEHGRPSFIHVHVCMHAGVYALWAKLSGKISYVVTEHYSIYIPGNPGSFQSRSFFYRYINKLILKNASGIHNVSRFLQDCMRNIAPLRTPVIIPNAVNTDWFRLPEAKESSLRLFRFIHVSSFDENKNVEGILEAFGILALRRTDWELMLVGPAGEEIREKAASLSGHCHWTGAVTYAEVAAELQQASALVLFSGFENQPCVISEAFCCGLPVIASAVGGIPEVVRPGNGLLVKAGDITALAEALEQMMTTYEQYDPGQIAGEARARHSYSSIATQFIDFYEAALLL